MFVGGVFSEANFTELKNYLKFTSLSETWLGRTVIWIKNTLTSLYVTIASLFLGSTVQPTNEQSERCVNPASPIEVKVGNSSSPGPISAKIALARRNGGFVGPLDDLGQLKTELENWSYENGDAIPLEPTTLLLDFQIFDSQNAASLLNAGYFSPSFLFDSAKEGDSIRLQYKGQLVELTIDQSILEAGLRKKRVTPSNEGFSETFKATQTEILKRIEVGDLGFSGTLSPRPIFQPIHSYTLEHSGVLFQALKDQEDEWKVKKCENQSLRSLGSLSEPKMNEYKTAIGRIFQLALPGVANQIDIVVNEKFICFYAEPEPLINISSKRLEVCRDEGVLSLSNLKASYFRVLKWREYFSGISTEEMQVKVANSTATLADGIFTLTVNN